MIFTLFYTFVFLQIPNPRGSLPPAMSRVTAPPLSRRVLLRLQGAESCRTENVCIRRKARKIQFAEKRRVRRYTAGMNISGPQVRRKREMIAEKHYRSRRRA